MDQFKKSISAAIRKPVVAAALSFLFPGLGQAAAGDRNRGLIVSIPIFGVIAAFLLIVIFDRGSLLGLAVNQQWLTSLLILDVVALLYHVWAIVDSYRVASKIQSKGRRRTSATTPWGAVMAIVLIVSGALAIHGAVAKVDMDWQHALYCITARTPCWLTDNPNATGTLTYADPGDNGDPIDPNGSGSPTASTSTGPLTSFDPSGLPTFHADDAVNWAEDGQLNVLIIGADFEANTSRSGLRPDTMIVAHVDLSSGKAALIGVPRNNVCVPLPQDVAQHYATAHNGCPASSWAGRGGISTGELNWLAQEAANHPANFPSYPQSMSQGDQWYRGALATEQAVGTLLGLAIDGYVTLNLSGLSTLIDDLGGIDINVPQQVYDRPCGSSGTTWAQPGPWGKAYVCAGDVHSGYAVPGDFSNVQKMIDDAANSGGLQSISWHGSYSSKDDKTSIAFTIKPGLQHMDGNWTLAYARTRKFAPGADFGRMKRQQLVIQAMRKTFDPCTILPKVPGLIQHIGDAFNTNLPIADAPQWAKLGQRILGGNLKMIVLDPASTGESFIAGYPAIDGTSWAKIKGIVAHSLDSVPAATSGGNGGGLGC
jgi:anionic cell wall polymer biosynthesis LytR-Cps2A-Psr (LCP) family protein